MSYNSLNRNGSEKIRGKSPLIVTQSGVITMVLQDGSNVLMTDSTGRIKIVRRNKYNYEMKIAQNGALKKWML